MSVAFQSVRNHVRGELQTAADDPDLAEVFEIDFSWRGQRLSRTALAGLDHRYGDDGLPREGKSFLLSALQAL